MTDTPPSNLIRSFSQKEYVLEIADPHQTAFKVEFLPDFSSLFSKGGAILGLPVCLLYDVALYQKAINSER